MKLGKYPRTYFPWFTRLNSILFVTMLILCIQPIQLVQAGTITVNNITDENDGSCSDGDCSLREAIDSAVSGDTIDFSVQGTITLTLGELVIDKNLNIDGGFAGKLTISGGGSSRVIKIGLGKTVTLAGVTIADGYIDDMHGGGIYNQFGLLTLNECTLKGNSSLFDGGGIYTFQGTVEINESTFSGNSADNGGGIYNNSGDITINNSTISGNDSTTAFDGGGIFNRDGTITLNYSTITDNTTNIGDGGGIYNYMDMDTATVNFNNTIIAGNSGTMGEDCYNSGGTFVSQDYNLTGIGTGCGLSGTHDQTTADALLLPLAYNGGGTQTHALDAGSPAINQIPPGTNGCGTTYIVDQRGMTRPQGAQCDIGAFEVEISPNDTIGMYSPPQKTWYLKEANDDGWSNVQTFRFGSTDSSWVPVVGDWDEDGADTIGIYSPGQKTWYLKDANNDGWGNVATVRFGSTDSSWLPVVGDWDGDGTDTIGIYSRTQKTWYLKDTNTDGWSNITTVRFGSVDTSWVPVVGDWNGNGTDTIGIYSPPQKTWYLKDANNDGWSNLTTVRFGSTDTSWVPVVGDWNGNDTNTIAMYSRSQKTWYLKDANTDGWGDVTTVRFGSVITSWAPVVGKWTMSP